MLKAGFIRILFLPVFISAFASCSKDSVKKPETFIVSPDTLINMTGRDWNDVELQLKGKVIYSYTDVPIDQVSPIKAAVYLPVIDTGAGPVHCSLLLNVESSTNKVVTIFMQTVDSMPGFGREEAYALMLYYGDQSIKTKADTTAAFGMYEAGNGTQVTTTADDVLSKLRSGFETKRLSIRIYSGKKDLSLILTKQSDERYLFSFDSHASP